MAAVLRTFFRSIGPALLGAFAVPIGGAAGIASIISFLLLVFSSKDRSFGVFCFFLASVAVCYFAIKALQSIAERGRLLVESINTKESINLNSENMLGYPSPAFFVFDKNSRKLAICNSVTGDYKIHDFSYILKWYYEWGTGSNMNIGITGGAYIPGTSMREPTITQTEYKKNFALVLEVADENNPFFKFPMQGEAPAKRWCAKLNAIFNG